MPGLRRSRGSHHCDDLLAFLAATAKQNSELESSATGDSNMVFSRSDCTDNLSLGWAIPEVLTVNSLEIIAAGKLLSIADRIFTIFWAFGVRNGLNTLLCFSKNDKTRFGGVWKLFGIFYLQFKLNRLQTQQSHETQSKG